MKPSRGYAPAFPQLQEMIAALSGGVANPASIQDGLPDRSLAHIWPRCARTNCHCDPRARKSHSGSGNEHHPLSSNFSMTFEARTMMSAGFRPARTRRAASTPPIGLISTPIPSPLLITFSEVGQDLPRRHGRNARQPIGHPPPQHSSRHILLIKWHISRANEGQDIEVDPDMCIISAAT